MTFKRAQRKQVKLKLALTGPSGAGKTFSALKIASGMGKRIALIDTENCSASLYADRFQFDTLEIAPPYTIARYVDAMKAAIAAGYDVLIIDSISHAWAGDGGLLSKKEALDVRGGNQYTNWAPISKEHEQFKAMILNADIHLICTMRSKQDYVLELNDKGKSVPRKVGLAPIQRDGLEYEFTTVFDIAMDHNAQASKDRTSLFTGQVIRLTEQTGADLLKWLGQGEAADAKALPPGSCAPDLAEAVDSIVAQGPAPEPARATIAQPRNAGVPCHKCGAEIGLARGGLGYRCPNWKTKGDGHANVLSSALEKYKAAAPATV